MTTTALMIRIMMMMAAITPADEPPSETQHKDQPLNHPVITSNHTRQVLPVHSEDEC